MSAWSIYRVFKTAEGTPLFIGVISDLQWRRLCQALGREDWANDPRLETNQGRLEQAEWFTPALEEHLGRLSFEEACRLCAKARVCYAPITRPEDLFDDPQLNTEKRPLIPTQLPNGEVAGLPRVPLEMSNTDFGLYHQPPSIGQESGHYLTELGYSEEDQARLTEAGIIAESERLK